MKLTLAFAKYLHLLSEGQTVNYGLFRGGNRDLLNQFINDGVLDYVPVGTMQKKIFCADAANLHKYLHHKLEIPSLTDFITFMEMEEAERSDAVRATSNSKFNANTKVFSGFLVNAYEKIECMLNGQAFTITPRNGTFTFIYDYPNFIIPPDITVVGVEGHENFRGIERQRYLFTDTKVLFLWRYQNSTAIADWMNCIPNNYLHFGDYDPKGLHIYLSEFRNKIGAERCSLFVPPELEQNIDKHGERELYDKQEQLLPLMKAANSDKDVSFVMSLLEKYRKGLAQEVFIRHKIFR